VFQINKLYMRIL